MLISDEIGGLMKVVWIPSIGLFALSMLTPSARAQQQQISVPLVQTAQLITKPHPGVNADILGIRVGMTVPEAEAIAAKTYPGKPKETMNSDMAGYRSITVNSKPYVSRVDFRISDPNNSSNSNNWLTLYFSSPATGNEVVAMYREIDFPDPLHAPLLSAVKASLVNKYGSFSLEKDGKYKWQFGKQSLERPPYAGVVSDIRDGYNAFESAGIVADGAVMGIVAYPVPSNADNTKVSAIEISIVDYQDASNSMSLTTQQLKNTAMKRYDKISKPTAVPKF